jgi:uncharacterized damage-inducible protein DinB
MARDAAVAVLLQLLDEAFDRKAWHGTNLRGSVRGLDLRRAAWRPGPGRHSVWELTVHAAYWKYAVRRQITGEKRGSFPERGSNWFARQAEAGEAAWRRDVLLLVDQHRKLRATVAALRGSDLGRRPRGSRYTIGFLVRGAASHDLYHAGQIQLLKRLGA